MLPIIRFCISDFKRFRLWLPGFAVMSVADGCTRERIHLPFSALALQKRSLVTHLCWQMLLSVIINGIRRMTLKIKRVSRETCADIAAGDGY